MSREYFKKPTTKCSELNILIIECKDFTPLNKKFQFETKTKTRMRSDLTNCLFPDHYTCCWLFNVFLSPPFGVTIIIID